MHKKLFWQLYPSFLLITLLSLTAAGWYATSNLKTFYLQNLETDLKTRAELVADLVQDHFNAESLASVDSVLKNIGKRTSTRFTAILPDGEVIGDSEKDPGSMDNHGMRPEVKNAYLGLVGVRTRYSKTIGKDMMYVAVPVSTTEGNIVGVMRASVQVQVVSQTLGAIYDRLMYGGLAIAFFAGLVSIFIAQRIGKPIQRIRKGAEEFAAGNLAYRLDVPPIEEVGALAITMNQMAAQLYERIITITQQRNELEAVLASMVEAVIAFDTDFRVIWFNHAAQRQFEIDTTSGRQLGVFDVTDNEGLHDFARKVLASSQAVEGNIVLARNNEERYLQANGTMILNAKGKQIGALIVLNDITRIIRLEKVRRDFVANVSHELKTPITSIKGFVETLKNGAINDVDHVNNFLDIIGRHSDRLTSIIEDLLSLSRIEQDAENQQIEKQEVVLLEVLESAVLFCEQRAKQKQIRIQTECTRSITAHINPNLLEQAVVNLIDNAIKYSPESSEIRVLCYRDEQENVSIRVMDRGCGIPPEDLPRIFERFYRVDKARSRKLGGTGLGLSIVKHIAQAHGGRVDVQSQLGSGSTFTIRIPAA
jgi:two-component system phosphate regulon sensor histidine kinase PhoR